MRSKVALGATPAPAPPPAMATGCPARALYLLPSLTMRLTSSFAVFRFQPGEKGLAKARWYSREGKAAEAERAYRAAIAANPDLRAGWLELFELLRRDGRYHDALELALRAEDHFGPDTAMPRAIPAPAKRMSRETTGSR